MVEMLLCDISIGNLTCQLLLSTLTISNHLQEDFRTSTLLLMVATMYIRKFVRERCKKKKLKKKLTNVSFMYVCVAENGEMLVFFLVFFPTIV